MSQDNTDTPAEKPEKTLEQYKAENKVLTQESMGRKDTIKTLREEIVNSNASFEEKFKKMNDALNQNDLEQAKKDGDWKTVIGKLELDIKQRDKAIDMYKSDIETRNLEKIDDIKMDSILGKITLADKGYEGLIDLEKITMKDGNKEVNEESRDAYLTDFKQKYPHILKLDNAGPKNAPPVPNQFKEDNQDNKLNLRNLAENALAQVNRPN